MNNTETEKNSRRKPVLIACIAVLLAMILAQAPMIYKNVSHYFFYGYCTLDSTRGTMIIISLACSWWFWFMGLSAKKWKKGIPLFLGGAALIIASYFLPIEDGHNINWKRAQTLIFIAWIMLHIEYCLPVSVTTRRQVSATILVTGVPVTVLAIFLSAFGASFGSGKKISEGIIFFPLLILGPFVFLFLVRLIIQYWKRISRQDPLAG